MTKGNDHNPNLELLQENLIIIPYAYENANYILLDSILKQNGNANVYDFFWFFRIFHIFFIFLENIAIHNARLKEKKNVW